MSSFMLFQFAQVIVHYHGVQLFTASGQRISKTVNGTTYNYHYLGDQLVEMAWGANRMHFTYDAVGPLSVNFNGTEYFYLKNAQGDVTGLADSTGAKVVAYTYGPWGESWGVSGTLASTLGAMNPLRYRGYVYDTETGLYYLNSRYYNPTWGRFINTDSEMAGIGGDTQGYNLFAYCQNNPVNMSDHDGNWPKWATKLVAAAAIVAVVTVVAAVTVATAGAGTVAAVVAVGAAKGAVVGMLSGAVLGAVTEAVSHRVSSGSWRGAGTAALDGMSDGALSGATSGMVAGMASSAAKASHAARKVIGTIKNDVLGLPRVGSALKPDPYHAFSDIIDNYAGYAAKKSLGNATLYQLKGSLNGTAGRFEWIIQNNKVTHRFFVAGGVINGLPNKPN